MLKFNQNLLLNEAWQDLGMHNQDLVTVVEAVAWAKYKKLGQELYIQAIDYKNWNHVDISMGTLDSDLIDIIDESTTCEAILFDHHIRIRYKK